MPFDEAQLTALAQQVLVVIPARYGSTRFEGKPLALIGEKPMIQHVVERVGESLFAQSTVVVATDDERIAQVVRAFGGTVQLTDANHLSGSDRVWEVAKNYPHLPYVLNIQGDEPFIKPTALNAVLDQLASFVFADVATVNPDILTLVTPLADSIEGIQIELANPNCVKAVRAVSGQVLYFSRAGVPFVRDGFASADAGLVGQSFFRHLGVYLYSRSALERFVSLPPSPLELLEKLEQLRAMEAGFQLFAAVVPEAPIGVDTPEDLARLNAVLNQAG
ncbi:MAG: 3-deoxy-manno-octulosonate cytidylyltransferase [Candidatus Melainabacteria bacterium]|jgi:3-deoxy-manno-octulosonate cytidylyltransferase (CMP-KDO synthetase)|nr:3-deoxy-manno-octulosonate cytidylyltransferase [Candidatus Melainabacteria bacterium]